jgi:hypothetical protein
MLREKHGHELKIALDARIVVRFGRTMERILRQRVPIAVGFKQCGTVVVLLGYNFLIHTITYKGDRHHGIKAGTEHSGHISEHGP